MIAKVLVVVAAVAGGDVLPSDDRLSTETSATETSPAKTTATHPSDTSAPRDEWTDAMIIDAIEVAGDGYSTDEILVRQSLRQQVKMHVESAVATKLDADSETRLWLRMLNLRKAGKMTVKATRRGPRVDEAVLPVAELAVRAVVDRHRITTDTVLADPRLREELQSEATLIDPQVDADSVRKAVLSLRKRRALKPELVLKVTQWDRTIVTYSLDDLRMQLSAGKISDGPGVYLFRSPAGYLYIGEAADLSERLETHLGGSDRKSLADFLESHAAEVSVEIHQFAADSPGRKVAFRRAYESELIRSRNPTFNLRP